MGTPDSAIPIGVPEGGIPTRTPELLELLLLEGCMITWGRCRCMHN